MEKQLEAVGIIVVIRNVYNSAGLGYVSVGLPATVTKTSSRELRDMLKHLK